MLPLLLGLGAALAYGTSDFLGGLLARRIHFGLVSVIGATAAFGVTLLAALVVGGAAPTPSALVLGAISGVGGGLGTMALYRGLGRGQMGIVAPLSALGTAALPVLIGVILGDRPSVAAWAGVALALPAVWLVSTSASSDGGGSLGAGVIDGLLAGVGFALLLTGLGLAGDASGLWPVVASQAMASIVLGIVLMGVLRSSTDAGRRPATSARLPWSASSARWRQRRTSWPPTSGCCRSLRCSPRCIRRSLCSLRRRCCTKPSPGGRRSASGRPRWRWC